MELNPSVPGVPVARAWRTDVIALAIALFVVISCSTPPLPDGGEQVGGDARAAAAIVSAWLREIGSEESPDRGWRWLYPATRTDVLHDDRASYTLAARAASWDGFRWSVRRVDVHDGEYHVTLAIEHGESSVPRFLLRLGLLQLLSEASTEAVVTVRIAPGGTPRGIQAVG